MKLSNLIAAGLTATLLSTGVTYAQTATTPPADVQVMIKNEMMAQVPEVMAMVEALKAEGFTYIEIRRTMLGRARILAYGANSMREVVMNANTGEVMRNIMSAHDGSMAQGMEAMQQLQDEMQNQMDNNGGGMGGDMGNGSDMGGNGDMGSNKNRSINTVKTAIINSDAPRFAGDIVGATMSFLRGNK